jgi:thymidine phosphorylase
MLVMGEVARDEDEARAMLTACVRDGRAADVARRMITAQGGDPRAVDSPSVFARANVIVEWKSPRGGFIRAIDTHAVGNAGIALGAGRVRAEDTIDPAVGFVFKRNTGDKIRAGDLLVTVHAASERAAEEALARLEKAVELGDSAPADVPLVLERVG